MPKHTIINLPIKLTSPILLLKIGMEILIWIEMQLPIRLPVLVGSIQEQIDYIIKVMRQGLI